MSTVERKEYQETKILRTVSPTRNIRGSNQNLQQFDSNLDYLLEDLQNSVSRPGSSLGHNTNTYRETSRSVNTLDSGRSNSLNRITNVKSSNPVTEYSSDDAYSYKSPDGRQQVHGYKKEKYLYKTSSGGIDTDIMPEKSRMQNSINQLDSLLDDLQQVKKSSYSDKESYNSPGLDPNYQTKSTTRTVNRELHYGDTPRSSSRSRTLERTERDSSLKRDIQYTGEGTYGDLRPLRTTSPSPSSRTSTLSKQTKVSNVHEYPVHVVETSAPDIDPEVLAHLDPNLHPPGNTKVTTTIKTYTYEIPGSGTYPTNLGDSTTVDTEKYVYSPNQTLTTPSKSFVYNKIENKENTSIYKQEPSWQETKINQKYKESVTDNINYYPPYQKPSPPGGVVVKETITTRNYQPGYQPDLNPPVPNQTYIYNESTTTKNINQPPHQPDLNPPKQTYIYNESTTKNINQNGYPQPAPPRQETYIVNKETTNIVNKNDQPPFSDRGYPVGNPPYPGNQQPPSKNTYIIKETHTTNYQNGGYPPNRPNSPPSDVETFGPSNPPYGRRPNEPVNIHYKYKSTNTTENRFKGGYPPGDETEALLPRKFPTDEGDIGPPRRLDELMATIGNEPPNSPLNAGYNAHEQELAQQKKIDTLKKQQESLDDTQKKELVPKSKNVSGPPVYYPPGHEMFATKEEGGGGWRAEGQSGKASGKYMYEAESKSKSKSSSGATVVPVCLPLCCGLPCALL